MTQFVLAVVLGTLFAIGTFLMLRRDVVRVVWGVTIIGQTANVYLITMGGLGGGAPILGHGPATDPATVSDPLVQALVLTAIVIGFGTTALALVLTYRVYQEHGTLDLGTVAERESPPGFEAVPDGGPTAGRTDAVADDDAGVDDAGVEGDSGVDDLSGGEHA